MKAASTPPTPRVASHWANSVSIRLSRTRFNRRGAEHDLGGIRLQLRQGRAQAHVQRLGLLDVFVVNVEASPLHQFAKLQRQLLLIETGLLVDPAALAPRTLGDDHLTLHPCLHVCRAVTLQAE